MKYATDPRARGGNWREGCGPACAANDCPGPVAIENRERGGRRGQKQQKCVRRLEARQERLRKKPLTSVLQSVYRRFVAVIVLVAVRSRNALLFDATAGTCWRKIIRKTSRNPVVHNWNVCRWLLHCCLEKPRRAPHAPVHRAPESLRRSFGREHRVPKWLMRPRLRATMQTIGYP